MSTDSGQPEQPNQSKISAAQWRLFFTVMAIGAAGMFYTLLRWNKLADTAALYLGVPLILALGLSLTPRAKSATGATMKGITIALLLSAPVFGEGFICIIFAAPIFYGVGALCAIPIDRAKKKKEKMGLQTSAVVMVVALLSLEGTTELTTIPRFNEVEASKVVNASVADIKAQLAKPPVFDSNKPVLLKIFPYPAQITGEGIGLGDERVVRFVAYKHIWWKRVEGDLVLRVIGQSEHDLRFNVPQDTSYLGHYLKWESSEVRFEPIDASHTRVTWRLTYHRKLDPSWYFGPLQSYAVRLAAEELIEHVATPRI